MIGLGFFGVSISYMLSSSLLTPLCFNSLFNSSIPKLCLWKLVLFVSSLTQVTFSVEIFLTVKKSCPVYLWGEHLEAAICIMLLPLFFFSSSSFYFYFWTYIFVYLIHLLVNYEIGRNLDFTFSLGKKMVYKTFDLQSTKLMRFMNCDT